MLSDRSGTACLAASGTSLEFAARSRFAGRSERRHHARVGRRKQMESRRSSCNPRDKPTSSRAIATLAMAVLLLRSLNFARR